MAGLLLGAVGQICVANQQQRAHQDGLNCCEFGKKGSFYKIVNFKDKTKEISIAEEVQDNTKMASSYHKKQQISILWSCKTAKVLDFALRRELQNAVFQNGGSHIRF